jgi:hypothetical protein
VSESTPGKSASDKPVASTATKPAAKPSDEKKPHLVEPVKKGGATPDPRTAAAADTTAIIPPVKDPVRAAPSPGPVPAAGPAPATARRARLRLAHIEPWSVTRLAFVVSVAMMIVAVVAVSLFWVVLDMTGVWGQVNDSVTSVLSDSEDSFDITDYLGFGRLFGLTLLLSAINVVVMTVLATVAAHLYNLAAQLLGGIEVTFRED